MTNKIDKNLLNEQNPHWEETYTRTPEMFGEEPSESAKMAVKLFQKKGMRNLLELGAGQGRDTLFFAQTGFQIHAIDYSDSGVKIIREKAQTRGLSQFVSALRHDVRRPLPFGNESLDACYSHMLFCMALTTAELEFLSNEVRRVLKPGGLCLYTVRNTSDPHYGTGNHRGEDMYEVGGFIVHFFSREQVVHISNGYEIAEVEEFEEGALPKKLFCVTLSKK